MRAVSRRPAWSSAGTPSLGTPITRSSREGYRSTESAVYLTAPGHDASGGVNRDELAAAVAGPGIAHRPAHQRGPPGTDPGPGPGDGSHPACPRCPASTHGIAGLVAAPAASTRPPISRAGRSLASHPRIYDRGLKVMHLRLHGIALVCIPWWPPPRPVSSAWRTGFPSSLRVSGCDKLHPGMYSPHRQVTPSKGGAQAEMASPICYD